MSLADQRVQDGPLSLRTTDYTTVFPAGITVAAAWDRNLALTRAQYMGAEFRAKGAHVYLGPVAGPLGRSGYGGRNWEGFSPDPYLTGDLFAQTIIGIEEAGVQAAAKHYVTNEQETQRNPSTFAFSDPSESGVTIEAVSSNLGDRTLVCQLFQASHNRIKLLTMCTARTLRLAFCEWRPRRSIVNHVRLQPDQWILRLSEQQAPQRRLERGAGLPGL